MKKQVKKPIDYIPPAVDKVAGYYKEQLNAVKQESDARLSNSVSDLIKANIASGNTVTDDLHVKVESYRGDRTWYTVNDDSIIKAYNPDDQPKPKVSYEPASNIDRPDSPYKAVSQEDIINTFKQMRPEPKPAPKPQLTPNQKAILQDMIKHNRPITDVQNLKLQFLKSNEAVTEPEFERGFTFKHVGESYLPNLDIELKDEDIVKKDYSYRCIISKNKIHCNYIRFPKGLECTDEELIAHAERGSHRDVQFIDYLPNQLPDFINKPVKRRGGFLPGRAPAFVPNIDPGAFALKTNQLFDKPVDFDTYLGLTMAPGMDHRIFRGNIVPKLDGLGHLVDNEYLALKNIFLVDGLNNLGVSTGVVKGNSVEVIALDNYASMKETTSFKITEFNLDTVRVANNRHHNSKFFRFKVVGSDKSSEVFKQKTAKKKYVGKILPADFCRYYPNWQAADGATYNVFVVYQDAKELVYLAEEIEIIGINSAYLQKQAPKQIKSLEKGKKARVVDDKRLMNLVKGDIVTITSITSKANKRSVATVTAENGSKHTILLKQLKPYVNIKEISGKASIAAKASTKTIITIEEKDIVSPAVKAAANNYKNSNFF